MLSGRQTKTESEQVGFFAACLERSLKAVDAAGAVHRRYRVGGRTVDLTFAGEGLVPFLAPALEHLRIPADHRTPDLTLYIWDSHSTGVPMVPPPCPWDCFTDRGEVWGFNSDRVKFAFYWTEYSVNLLDHAAKRGIFWVPKGESLPYWACAAPLRAHFHWWMEANGSQLLHAAAVGNGDGAVLLTGRGGIGKSTTALSCLRSGWRYLADDYVIVQQDPEPLVYSVYCTAKLNADHVGNFPELLEVVQNSQRLDREKAVIALYPRFGQQIVPVLPLKAIVVPVLAGVREPRLTPAPDREIQRATSFTTMCQLPHVGRRTLDFTSRLSSRLPGFTLELGENAGKVPSTLLSLVPGPGRNPPHRRHNAAPRGAAVAADGRPLVSVIIPVFNGERFITDAVENVLSQRYPALELIVVDDGSTDRTADIVSSLTCDVRYFKQANAGPASARNRGIKDASGEFVAFLDVDDLWPDNTLPFLVDELLRDPQLDVVHGYDQLMQRTADDSRYESIGKPDAAFPYSIAAGLYRTSVFDRVGLFDPTLIFGEDTDWFARAKELGVTIKRLDAVTLLVRRHGANMTQGKDIVQLNTLRVFKKALDRKRAREAPEKKV